jgi:hypothetical protein
LGHLVSPYLSNLSTEFTNDIEWVTQSIEASQDEVDSLASVVLQNRHAFDLLTAEKGGPCLFLNEKCCFYTNIWGSQRCGLTGKRTHYKKETRAGQFVVLLEPHMGLGSLGTTSGWRTFYAPSNTPIWPMYNKRSLQIHIPTGPAAQTPAFSQGVLTSAYA